MSYIEKVDWSEKDLNDIIDAKVEENLHLDFKAAGALDMSDNKKKEIAKDVSAFANSDGGIIIYGMKEDKHVASEIDFIDGGKYTKEWLENIILANIDRPIPDLHIYPIRINGEILKSVYIVSIPASVQAPHINNRDKKFYKRYDFQSVAMEEYEIRNLYNRIGKSRVVYSSTEASLLNPNRATVDRFWDFRLGFQVLNASTTVADLYKVVFAVSNQDINVVIDENSVSKLTDEKAILYSNKIFTPLFPHEVLVGLSVTLRIQEHQLDEIPNLGSAIINVFSGSNHHKREINLGLVIANVLWHYRQGKVNRFSKFLNDYISTNHQ